MKWPTTIPTNLETECRIPLKIIHEDLTFEGARLQRLLKKSVLAGVLKGRTFRCAVKLFIFVIPSGLQPARDLRFGLFQQPVKPCPFKACCHQLPKRVNNPSEEP